ncbi:MAG TPA: sugar ABC transporter permease [Phycisphaerales bacterium]|nr:sugar ABC transporter permease [Phycisphaerales bacterium]
MSTRRHEDSVRTGLLWISPWLLGFTLFLLTPLAMSVYYSLSDYPVLERPVFIGLANYKRLFTDPTFWIVLKNTLIFSLVFVPASTLLALGLAALLNKELPGWKFARAIIVLPTLVPAAAAAMAWLWLLNSDAGLINRLLSPLLAVFNLAAPAWLQSRFWAMPAIIIVSLWQVGQSVLIYQAALREVPESLQEAAELDGLTGLRRFWHVTLPMISPVVLFNVVIGIIGAMQVFVFPFIMTNGGPGTATYFYSMYLYDNAFLFGPQMGYACAMAWVQMMMVGALTWLLFRMSRKKVHYRGGGA